MTARSRFLISAALTLVVGGYLVGYAPLPFIPSWWMERACSGVDPFHKAARIADGLLLTNRLSGMSREQVIALLGAPPPTDYFSGWDLRYCLGLQRGFLPMDDEWLVIRLDEHKTVQEARLLTD